MYGRFNWESELENFWQSVKNLKANKDSSVPLYAHILLRFFWDDCQNIPSLEDLSRDAGKWKLINYEIQKDLSIPVIEVENGVVHSQGKKNHSSRLPDAKPNSIDQCHRKSQPKVNRNVKSKISASFSNSSYNGT